MGIIFDYWAILAGGFAILSVAFSFYEIIKHLINFTKPYLQRYIIRILLMVPIYSLNAWIAMIIPETGLYLDSMREVYESFVIYSFMKYLLNFLQFDTNLQQYIHHKTGPGHIFPFCCLPNCVGGRLFLIRCKHGILQYVVIRPITSVIAFTSQLFGFYGEGNYNPLSGYTYPVLLIINNGSQILAMYCLVIFYTGYQQELRPMKPLAKFFSIKLVVFFSFFQSVLISGLLEIDFVEEFFRGIFPELDDKISIGRKVQELLICFDMLIAAIGHLFAFSYLPFTEYGDREQLDPGGGHRACVSSDNDDCSCCHALCSIFDFSDEKSDIREHFSELFVKIKQLFTFRPALPTIISRDDEDQLNDDWMTTQGSSADNSANGNRELVPQAPASVSAGNYRTIG